MVCRIHILIYLEEKILSVEQVDEYVRAEFLDKMKEPELFDLVCKHMI